MSTQRLDLPATLGLPAGIWQLNRDGSRIGFTARTLWGLVAVKGHFAEHDGTLRVLADGVTAQLTIDAASLDTRHAKRDAHLRSADFFNVAEHPRITFTSTAVTLHDDGLVITGDLTIGTTANRLQLPVTVQRGEHGRLRLQTTATITREQADMTWNRMGMIRGDAHLHADIELVPAA